MQKATLIRTAIEKAALLISLIFTNQEDVQKIQKSSLTLNLKQLQTISTFEKRDQSKLAHTDDAVPR